MKSFIIRIVLFACLVIPLTYLAFRENSGPLTTGVDLGFSLGIASVAFVAIRPDELTDWLAKAFSMFARSGDGLYISSTWLFWVFTAGPILPILGAVFVAGIFDHSVFPDRPGNHLAYTLLGVGGGVFFVFFSLVVPSGFRCMVSKGNVKWVTTYCGRALRAVEYPNARIVNFEPDNGAGGGPVVTIRYDAEQLDTATARLKFRNLVGLTPEEFHEALSEYLVDESHYNASRMRDV